MFTLDSIFTTKTAIPIGCGMTEVLPSSHFLRQYIRCFWKYDGTAPERDFRIIPDCCADIIVPLDGSPSVFVGTSDQSFVTRHAGAVFGIRFYAWAVAPFLHIYMRGAFNGTIAVGSAGVKGFAAFTRRIADARDFAEQTAIAQEYLLRLFDGKIDADVMNGIYYAVKTDCRASMVDMARYCATSNRTLERKFAQSVGISPKATLELLRYQLLWQDATKRGFSVADSVFKLGYFDEAHLYNDFKKYHGLSLAAARAEYAKAR